MPPEIPPAPEVILSHTQRSLGHLPADTVAQPGSPIVHGGLHYTVLERRHRYQFRANRYELQGIVLYVQPAPAEKTRLGDRWVIGDVTCRYNARSEILRCALHPAGPCADCPDYQPQAPDVP